MNTNQSSNWFGYNQASLEQGGTLLNSISSDRLGIGGGCVDSGCTVGDETLIQTGSEQDVSGGQASYSAWWERRSPRPCRIPRPT